MSTTRLIDTHAHVQFPAYDADRDEVIRRALDEGIGVINIGTQYSTSADAVRLADQYNDGVWASVGFHPHHADPDTPYDPWELHVKQPEMFEYDKFLELARHPKVVAVGECGLDYYRRADSEQRIADSWRERQKEVFQQQIDLAKEIKKPLVIHCRNAFDDLITLLSANRYTLSAPAGVAHFFSGSWEDAKKLLSLGFCFSFGGVVTFTRDYDEVIKNIPLDRLLLETDAPYVAPEPFRGQRNEPAYVMEVAKKIAELRGIQYNEVAHAVFENTKRLFHLTVT